MKVGGMESRRKRENARLHSVCVNVLVGTAVLKSQEMLRLGRASHSYKGTLCVLCSFSVTVKLFQNESSKSVQSSCSKMIAQNRIQWEFFALADRWEH